jgi:hypothetical protein
MFYLWKNKKTRVLNLYAEIEPYNTVLMQISEIHSLYYEEVGNLSSKP